MARFPVRTRWARRLAVPCMLMLAASAGISTHALADSPNDTVRVYLGTYTTRGSQGIYVSELDRMTGTLSEPRLAGEAQNPSFLAIHPTKPRLYAVGELGQFENQPGGAVFSFQIDDASGRLLRLNARSSLAGAPCHLAVDEAGTHVVAANYSGGNVISLPLRDDGSLDPVVCLVQHEGSGPHPGRQRGPHAHCVNLDPTDGRVLVADLGVDRIFVYQLDKTTGNLLANDPPYGRVAPGAGPRHVAFHPNGRWLYVINELASTVTAFNYDTDTGRMTEFQTLGTLPDDFDGVNTTAEIVVHPSGRFVYGSNRGHNSIVVFAVDEATGRLTGVEQISSGGEWPRCFGIDPSGRFLLAANQNTDNVVVFEIDRDKGTLRPTGSEARVAAPVCVIFRELESR